MNITSPLRALRPGILARFATQHLIVLGISLAVLGAARATTTSLSRPDSSPTTPPPALPNYSVTRTSAHQRIWEADVPSLDTNNPSPVRKRRIVETGSGINYWIGTAWAPSAPQFIAQSNAFISVQSHCHVQIALDLNTTNAVTTSTTGPDGTTGFSSTPVGIGLYDPVSGESVMLGGITNCVGVQTDTNQITFEDAFPGLGNIIFTLERGSFRQDVALKANIDPADWTDSTGHSFSSLSQIRIYTEVYGATNPASLLRPLRVEQDQTVRQSMASPDFIDKSLLFGSMMFAPGKAVTSGNATNSSAPVAKDFFPTTDGRWIMSESVEWRAIKNALQALPKFRQTSITQPAVRHATNRAATARRGEASGAAWVRERPATAQLTNVTPYSLAFLLVPHPLADAFIPKPGSPRPTASANRAATARRGEASGAAWVRERQAKPEKLAASHKPSIASSGITIDYVLTLPADSDGPFTFQGDVTYFISAPTYFEYVVTMEGGSCLKYPFSGTNDPSGTDDWYEVTGTTGACIEADAGLTISSDSYRPVVCSAADDNSVGDHLTAAIYSGYTGNPTGKLYACPAIIVANCSSTLNLSHFRFSYCACAIQFNGCSDGQITVAHSQFVNCLIGIALPSYYESVQVNDCLFAKVDLPLEEAASGGSGNTWNVCNCTFDNGSFFADTSGYVTCTNCIFSNMGDPPVPYSIYGCFNGFYNATSFGDNSLTTNASPSLSCCAAHYYLAGASDNIFRGAGTTNIDPALLADLRLRTTYPPVLYSNTTLSGTVTFYPQIPRETGQPDLGAAYPALDYILTQTWLTNGTFSVLAGTAIGTYPTALPAIQLCAGANFRCAGEPLNPVRITRLSTVQESPWVPAVAETSVLNASMIVLPSAATNLPQASLRFTKCYSLAQDCFHFSTWGTLQQIGFRDCEFFSGQLNLQGFSFYITNTLFERVMLELDTDDAEDLQAFFLNNLAHGGILSLGGSGLWTFRNNAFDSTSIQDGTDSGSPIVCDHNAYIGCTNYVSLSLHTGDLTLTNLAWQPGPLGNFYQLTNSALIDHGSSTNAGVAGFYFYTTQPGQTLEGTTPLDIGRHYVALDPDGQPFDLDGNGVADYLDQDSNGNGVPDWIEVLLGYNPSQPNNLGKTQPGYGLFIAQPKPASQSP